MPRDITTITIEQLEAAENAYREQNPNPALAGQKAAILELLLQQTTLAIPAGIVDGPQGIALGIEIGLILAEQSREEPSPVAVDQAVS